MFLVNEKMRYEKILDKNLDYDLKELNNNIRKLKRRLINTIPKDRDRDYSFLVDIAMILGNIEDILLILTIKISDLNYEIKMMKFVSD